MVDENGKTALHYAAILKKKDILEFLVKKKEIKFHEIDDNGLRAIDYLLLDKINDEMIELIQQFIVKNDYRTEKYLRNDLHSACQNRTDPGKAINLVIKAKEEEIPLLILSPLNIPTGMTPLKMAFSNNNVDTNTIVELIKKGKILEKIPVRIVKNSSYGYYQIIISSNYKKGKLNLKAGEEYV